MEGFVFANSSGQLITIIISGSVTGVSILSTQNSFEKVQHLAYPQ